MGARSLDGSDLGFRPRVKPGIQVLLEQRLDLVRGKQVGIITNPTGVLPNLESDVDVLATLRPDVDVVAIFGPEHGFRGTAQAGGSEGSFQDPATDIPVYDLYGKSPREIATLFQSAGVDVVLFDIQDVGARFYTYVWTMSDAMEAAAVTGTGFVVLDRPNPVGGFAVEGPVLDPAYSSFVGRYPIAQRHGMTVGELASLFNDQLVPQRTGGRKARLTVVPMEGWTRWMYYEDTGLPWVMPSVNMSTVDAAVVYPGNGLFEGTNISEGRGTTKPFQLLGAPYFDNRLALILNGLRLPGVAFRAAAFTPTFSKYAGQTVNGIETYVTNRQSYDPIRTAIAVMAAVRKLYGTAFRWQVNSDDLLRPYWIDKLTGSDWVRRAVDAGKDADETVHEFREELVAFHTLRSRYLLYTKDGGDRQDT